MANSRAVTVVIESNFIFREGLVQILRHSLLHVAAAVAHCDELDLPMADLDSPLFVLGLSPHGEEIGMVARLKQAHPDARIVILAERHEEGEVTEALHLGATSYILKNMPMEEFIKSMELAAAGIIVLSGLPSLLRATHLPKGDDRSRDGSADGGSDPPPGLTTGANGSASAQLSARESKILCLITEGDSNKVIARKLAIADTTVKAHIKSILRKVGARNRTSAAMWAQTNLKELLVGQASHATSSTRPMEEIPHPLTIR
jgi:two-component system nitrate/nitrite response regulator NarL